MRVIITGNSGFIGSFFTQKLLQKGLQVHGVDLFEFDGTITKHVTGNILDIQILYEIMAGCDLIIHLAAKHHEFIAGPQKGLKISQEDYYETNVQGTATLLEVATDLSIHNLIFLSSVLVYGSVNIPSNEEKIPQPEDEYGKSKYKAEQLIERWVEEDERNKALIIRPAAIYGKDCWANVYNLINSIENNKFLPIGKGENKKAIAYIDNLYDAVFFAWDNMVERLEIYNYTDYPILTTKELTDKIYEMLGKNKPKIYIPYKIGLAGGRVFDFLSKVINRNLPISSEKVLKFCSSSEHYADKIRDKNFIQKYTVDEGLKEMIEWKKAWLKNK